MFEDAYNEVAWRCKDIQKQIFSPKQWWQGLGESFDFPIFFTYLLNVFQL
jgi:hypothetical protein